MAKSIWRRSPGRLQSSDLIKKNSTGASALVADDFFEYVAPTNTTPSRISVSAQGPDFNITMPSGIQAGDIVIAYATRDGGAATDPNPTLWTPIANIYQSADGQPMQAAYHLCDGSESGSSVVYSFSLPFVFIVELWRGADPASPIGATSTYLSAGIGPSGAVTPISTTIPAVSTTVTNSAVVAFYGVDVTDNAPTYTFSTPSGFSGAYTNQYDYSAIAVFNKIQPSTGSSGGVASLINTESRLGIMFVINAVAGAAASFRALSIVSGKLQEVTDAQLGTGLKPWVLYNDKFVERVAAEGVPLVIDGNKIRELASGETLLI